MLEWSPPRILAVISLAFSAILSSSRAPTFAKPYPQQTFRYENIAGGYHEFSEGQLTEKIISENAHSKDRRSPTEDVDNPMSYVPARKRHGIETPIRPLENESDGTSISNEEKIASMRSTVDQPEPSKSVGLSTDDNNKLSGNKGSERIIGDTEGHQFSDNKPSQSQNTEQKTVTKSESLDEKGALGKNKATKAQQRIDTQDTQDQHGAEYSSHTQDSDQNNNVANKTAASKNSIMTSTEERGKIPSDKDSVDSSPKVAGKVNTQVNSRGESDNQGTSSKIAVPSEGSTSGGSQMSSSEAIRDKLGTSGSEIVTTTHGPYDESLPYYRDTESKPSYTEPQVGNFQVDDKSADLEINANSAGVKVKAKPASLQVVSRPGSHSAPSDTPSARSFYQHYRYPPFHRLHRWLPGFRSAFRPLRRHHLFRPYRIYPRDWFPSRHRYDYDPEDVDVPLHRRHSWYPHRRRGHYHEPYLYERSRMEAPMHRSRYQYDEPVDRRYRRRFHGRRFHRMRPSPRHHLYDRYGIPVMNNFVSPNMNVAPDADTMPQLPINPQMMEQMMIPPAQRQNIVTPVLPPINLFGNPPPSIMNGANFMGMNGMNNFGAMSTINGLGATSDLAGMTGVNTLDGLNGMRGNPLEGLHRMAGLNGEIGEGMPNLEGTQETRRHLRTRLPESAGRPVKKAAIQSVKHAKTLQKEKNGFKTHLKRFSSKKNMVDLKGWEKIIKHRHDLKTEDKTYNRSRRTTLVKHDELTKLKHNITNIHAQKSKDEKGNRKNAIIIHRPPIIYHPPPEIYHRPAIVVHRAPIMLHRPPIIYHQPPVVVHRPAIIYHQPSIVFHQPPPVVNQPIMHSRDTYVTKPVVYQTNSVVSHTHTYYGIPSNVYSGSYGCHGPHCAFRKGDVPRNGNIADFTKAKATKAVRKEKRNIYSPFDFIASNEGAQEQLTYISKQESGRSKRESLSEYYSFLRYKSHPKSTIFSENEIQRKKKKDVVVNRPPIIYHPPPEIYHRPDIVVHRPPLVIHRPPIIYHQPPVIVHRPAVVYHQPPIVFHQPPPAVSQPLLYSHDSFMIHPTMYASHHGSVVRDSGHYVGIPNAISNYGHPLLGMPHFHMGKRSLVGVKPKSHEKVKVKSSSIKDKDNSRRKIHYHPKNNEKAGKKNSILIARPPIIYHPPPEVYHRPVIVVHRAPIMLRRAPIIYHQPPVVVHRPAIVYHQPPLIFHQPPPVVSQPILKSHDTWLRRPVVVPYASHISHHSTYVGIPDSFSTHIFGHYHGHFGHGHAFYKSKIPQTSRPVENRTTPKNKKEVQKEVEKKSSSTIPQKHQKNTDLKQSLKRNKSYNEKGGKKNAVIMKRPPVIYHPPPEIYHRPVIIIHRAPIMIHRAAIIYHQPPVIVHRPAVVYHQPPLIFHQPPPVIQQTFLKSHDTWVPKPIMRLYSSKVHHAGHMYHIPNAYYYHGHGPVRYVAYDKSKVPRKSKLAEDNSDSRGIITKRTHHHRNQDKDETDMEQNHTGKKKHTTLKLSKIKTETGAKLHGDAKSDAKHHAYVFHREKETTETGAKKNAVIIHRPPIIYHPPPEVYHRPYIVVHRAPIVLYRAPIIYHQPPVVVHRPAIVYHQPPIVFHQPPPVVHQPVMHSHDTWMTKTVAVPYSTHVHHMLTYQGVPHEKVYMHGLGTGTFVKSHVPPEKSRRDKIRKNGSKHSKTSDGDHKIRGEVSNPIGTDGKIQRALQNKWRAGEENIRDETKMYSLRARREMRNSWMPFSEGTVSPWEDSRPLGAKQRMHRAVDDLRSTSEGEKTSFIHTSNVGKNEVVADGSHVKEGKDLKTGKRTILIIRRPPIIYHPPSHVVHRPSIMVHRQPLLIHRQPLIFHRPPILIRRPPIIIHRPPILFRRPPLFVHRPSLLIHRHPFIIHRAPFIVHHHPIMIHRPPIVIHKSPNFLVQHSSDIHHYPMHMVHVHCPGCGFGKSSILRVGGNRTERPNDREKKDNSRSHPHSNSNTMSKYSNLYPTARPTLQTSNKRKPFVSDHNYETARLKINKRETVPVHKKKKDVVVNRPPIIYHPPPEVYHRPDIVVHRAPILIHRPPIVYHQPPVVVHRPAVVYHQPPIVFHQPSPAVNQPVLYSHDSFAVHPMAFASHMGSVINDAGHYVGLPRGDINNYPGPLHGPITSTFSPALSRRGKVEKLQRYAKSSPGKPRKSKEKQTDAEKKNKVIVARPPMIYHPPPEIYDRPSVIVHRPDLVLHRPSIVYHQPSVVIHRPPVIYRQPPVVFHQPSPMTSQSITRSMDMYAAQPVFEPRATQVQHSSTYVGIPHFFPGYNNYGWQRNGNMLGWRGHSSGSESRGWGYGPGFRPVFGRSKVESATKKNKNGEKTDKSYRKGANIMAQKKRSDINNNRHTKEHHRHSHKHRQNDSDLGGEKLFGQKGTLGHKGHAKSREMPVNHPPLVYRPPTQVIHPPPLLISLHPVHHPPPLLVHRPPMGLRHHTPGFHHHHSHHYHAIGFGYDKSTVHGRHQRFKRKANDITNSSTKRNSQNGKTKNTVLVPLPPMIYHPPPDIYHKPDVIVHQPDVVIHRPSIVYQQSSVVVHRPSVVYHQPPVVFHQPPPLVHHPAMLSHETYLAHPVPVPFVSQFHHVGTYIGAPDSYDGAPWDGAFRLKSSVAKTVHDKQSKRKKDRPRRSATTHTSHTVNASSKADSIGESNRKNKVVMLRPAMIYHPPPEIYDKPDVIVHRPDYVIHQPSVVYHQPSVVVHRPPVVYRQPPVVFHQPPPMVHQPILNAHDSYVAQQQPVPYASQVQHKASYLGTPHFFPGGWNIGWGGARRFAYGKSNVPKMHKEKDNLRNDVVKQETKLNKENKKKDKGHKKNMVIIHRPPLIYHPPQEIYHRPSIIVHRPDLVIHRPSIVFHQPSVVVHRPSVIYHQPPVVFHQPPPMVNQPILHAHDTYLAHPYFVPNWSHGHHAATYVGAPHSFSGGWGWSWGHGHGDRFGFGHAFGKSKVEKTVGGRKNAKQNENISAGSRKKRKLASKQGKAKHPKSPVGQKPTNGTPEYKKNLVVMNRPPLIYHAPSEIYHRPPVIVHRPDLVIHRPSIVFHQPPVVVHRPSVIYHQPPIVFHQPSPMVHQPIIHSHETYVAHPFFSPFLSHVEHAGTYVGAPHAFHDGLGWAHGFGHTYGKSKVAKSSKNLRDSEKKVIDSADIQEKEHGKKRNQRSTKEPKANNIHKTSLPEASSRPLNKDKRKEHLTESTKNDRKANRKNLVIIRRPEMIYHPPAEIYDRPDIIVHRPELVYHQPSIVYHQPSVVVNRPPIIYNQPPVVFHQPSPMVNQPMFHERDEYDAHPSFVPYASYVQRANTYVGAPHAFPGGWGSNPGGSDWNTKINWGSGAWKNLNENRWAHGYGPAEHQFGPAVSKSVITKKVQNGSRHQNAKASTRTISGNSGIKQNHRPIHRQDVRNKNKAYITPIAKRMGAKISLNHRKTGSHVALRKEITGGRSGHKKNMVIMRRPTLVYHPPAEVYQRPDVIVHRPDIVIHRPSVVFHQSSVVVHRPPVIYHQPPVVFHQPPPMVHQPILHSHDTYAAHPNFEPFVSNIHHDGAYVGAPHYFHGGWGWGHGFGHSFGKSHVQQSGEEIPGKHTRKKDEITGQHKMHPEREYSVNPAKKNSIVVRRPPIIYHPPPEIYHRPDIVVHRPPIVLHRPPIIYHQPPVVVHRPAVVYHQPPIIFHQPPPVIHQPILHSHDSFVVHPEAHFVPHGSTVSHAINYVGIPSSVMRQNEFASHFHRSHIAHGKASTRKRKTVPVKSKKEIKSTISRIPITHKENTETAITDEAQKKTLRSYIGKTRKENQKRNTSNTHFSFIPVTPFNNIHPPGATVEQHQRFSNIPGKNSDRQRNIAKRLAGDRRKKRQAFRPAMQNIEYHSPLSPINNRHSLAGLQSRALPGTIGLDHFQEEAATHPNNVDYLTHVTGSSYLNAPLFHSSLVAPYSPVTPKEDSPEAHVHVETTKSAIPFSRTRRQISPMYPVSRMLGSTARFLYGGMEPLDPLHNLRVSPQPEMYQVVSPYQASYHPAQTGLAYNPYTADEHRPRVSINVNSERSRVPLAKRHLKQRTKRQLWSVRSPFPSMFPAPPSQSYFPHSPYSLISASPYQPGPVRSYAAGYGGLHSPYEVHRPSRPAGLNAGYNALLGYLNAIYGAYSRYPPYFNHHPPKVRVDVHTSRSNIQKAKKKSNNSTSFASRSRTPTLLRKRHHGNTKGSKRQPQNYRPLFPLSTEHYTLPLSTTKGKRSTKWGPRTGRSHLVSNNKRYQLEDNRFIRNGGDSQRQNDEVSHQSMERQFVGGNLNAAALNAEPSVNERSQALSQLNNLAEQEPIAQQDDAVQNVNQWHVPQARDIFAPQGLPLQSSVNRLPINAFPFPSPAATYQAQEQQFHMRRAPFPLSFASFPATVVRPLQELSQDASEQNQGHTSVNVEVTKSSVPKNKSRHATPIAERTSGLRGSVAYKKKVGVHQRSSNTDTKFAKRQFIEYLGGQSHLTPQLHAREIIQKKPLKKVKRQLQLMQLGGGLERRGSPKPLGAILKKPSGNGRFLLNSNYNKPVDVFSTDPVATNLPGIPQGKPKFQDSPIMEDQIPLKGTAQPVGLPVPAEMASNPFFQNSPPDATLFRQEPFETDGLPKALSEGTEQPMMFSSPPVVTNLGKDPGDAGLLRRGGLFGVNPLLLTPRVLPMLSVLSPHIPFDDHLQDTESLHFPLEAPSSPLLPLPFLPLPPPETSDFHPQSLQDAAAAAGQVPDDERPSIHVNVETSKSRIPNRASHWKHKTSRGNRG